MLNVPYPHFKESKSLQNNKQILITKPDKGSGVVILNQKYNISKIGDIPNDDKKLGKLGNVEQHDKTAKIEQNSKRGISRKELLTKKIYHRSRLTGSQ